MQQIHKYDFMITKIEQLWTADQRPIPNANFMMLEEYRINQYSMRVYNK